MPLDVYETPPTSRDDILKHCGAVAEHTAMISQLQQRVEQAFPNDCSDKKACMEAIGTLEWRLLSKDLKGYKKIGFNDYVGLFPLRKSFESEHDKRSYEDGFLIAYALSGYLDRDSVDRAESILTLRNTTSDIAN